MAKKLIVILTCIIILITASSCGKKEDPVPDPEPEHEDITPEPMPWDLFALNKLTGEYDVDKEFAGTRPVAVMVNNIIYCLTQRGIGS